MFLKVFLLLASVFCNRVVAHGYVAELIIGGKRYPGYHPYADDPKDPNLKRITYSAFNNWPIYDVASTNITCGYNRPEFRANQVAPAEAGSMITLFWTEWPNSHFGPTMTYLARCPGSCVDFDALDPSARFFKIHERGYDFSRKRWFQTDLHDNNSTMSLRLPRYIPSGEYIVRHELVSLHAADTYGAEFYPMCFLIKVSGGQGSTIPEGVEFPGAYSANDPGIDFNGYMPFTEYIIPGPRIFVS